MMTVGLPINRYKMKGVVTAEYFGCDLAPLTSSTMWFNNSPEFPALSVKEPPARSGIELANWNWKVVHQFVSGRFGISLSRSSCLNYPHLHEGRLCTAWDLF